MKTFDCVSVGGFVPVTKQHAFSVSIVFSGVGPSKDRHVCAKLKQLVLFGDVPSPATYS
jgi:hypothetical protein